MKTHVFDEAIALTPTGEHRYRGTTSAAYANMVSPFGGITAATMLNAVVQHPALLGEPRSLTINFCAAIADGAFDVTAQPVRTNRATQHWNVTLTQPAAGGSGQDEVMATATVVTAVRRDTWGLDDEAMPEVPRPESLATVPIPARFSAWVERYEMRPIEGTLPSTWDGSGSHSRTRMWVRDAEARTLDLAGITAFADVFFPRIWLRRARLVPAGTVSMTVYYHAGTGELARYPTGTWLFAQAHAQAFREGFFDQAAQLWAEDGRLLATSHQLVYYKE